MATRNDASLGHSVKHQTPVPTPTPNEPEAKGDCFPTAWRVAEELEARISTDPNISTVVSNVKVVHGFVAGRGKLDGIRHWHAWVEYDETGKIPTFEGEGTELRITGSQDITLRMAVDKSNGHDLTTFADVYRGVAQVSKIQEYTLTELKAEMTRHGFFGPFLDVEAVSGA